MPPKRRKSQNLPPGPSSVLTLKSKSKKSSSTTNKVVASASTSTSTSTSTSAVTAAATSLKPKKSVPEVVSLIDMEEKQFSEAVKRSIRDVFSSFTPSSSNGNKKQKIAEVIVLSDSDDDDDDDGGGKTSRCSSIGTVNLLDNKDGKPISDGDDVDDDDSEVMIVDATQARLQSSFRSSSATAKASGNGDDGDDDEIMEIGIQGGMDLVHMRQHCTKHEFVLDAKKKPASEQEAVIAKNKKCCDKCYCYICDVPANECKHWDVHCNASDKGLDAGLWKRMREKAKKGEITSTYPNRTGITSNNSDDEGDHIAESFARFVMSRMGFFDNSSGETDDDDNDNYSMRMPYNPFRRFGEEFCRLGPFEPNKVEVNTGLADLLNQCRKCKWWNKRHQYTNPQNCAKDWCQACGRVMSEEYFDRVQGLPSMEYKPKRGDFFMGTKNIPFRIKARDPRKINPYDAKWKELEGQEGWIYNEKEMKHDFYRHRITKKPKILMLLNNMAVFQEDKIPDRGSIILPSSSLVGRNIGDEYSALETEALIIDDQNHRLILQYLYNTRTNLNQVLFYNLEANWDEKSQIGNISLSVFLKQGVTASNPTRNESSFAYLLGAWYNVFPLRLSDLTNGLKCCNTPRQSPMAILNHGTGIKPFHLDKDDKERLVECFENNKECLDRYKREAKDISNKLSFLASSGKKHSGGVCINDNSLKGILTRYFKEALVEKVSHVRELTIESFGRSPAGQELGIKSYHRDVLGPRDHAANISTSDSAGIGAILDPEEAYIAVQYLRPFNLSTINGLMIQLENLHHNEVDTVEGLNVELFDFQRQTVGWALERETMVGGVQSTLWTKLDTVREFSTPNESKPVELYYSPVLDVFRKEKPEEVRGGIIGEQMGLGKTIISLALILANPAPTTPLTASLVKNYANSTVSTTNVSSQWPEKVPTDNTSPKRRAKYFSRGTLVVCNVSLVGQWIDEAKSKLKDPGLVYSYHGGGRKRCPVTLAKNAIVVTTYATLGSDSNYWRNKSGDPNYCPPCEQIWWWRIICDESHTLKDQNTLHFRALNSIQSVNRWCVTGTPMNTSVKDLRGQLAFIGIKNVSSYFSVFAANLRSHFKSSSKRSACASSSSDNVGKFLFMMRSIMMRHAIQMKSREENRSIMTLPPKEEKVVSITFSDKERKEYLKLEKDARVIYENVKASGTGQVSKNYLKISSALLPLRVACSGGVPEEDKLPNNAGHNTKESGKEKSASSATQSKAKKNKFITNLIFKSKFECLVKELKRIRDTEPQSKSLVFSQFFSTLQWMKQELPKHGFQFRTLSGDMPMTQRAKALRDFQQDPPTTVFLLSMRSGAVGINLTQANRVFLMEPAMNPALEAQAVGRVYRLGQRKSVQVIRMCIKDSVETRLMNLLEKKYGKVSKPEPKEGEEKKEDDVAVDNQGRVNTVERDLNSNIASTGSMNQDKAALLTSEFDLLFNVEGIVEQN